MMIEIKKEEYDELVRQSKWLTCLESAGVDNWDGFDFALDIWDDLYPGEDL